MVQVEARRSAVRCSLVSSPVLRQIAPHLAGGAVEIGARRAQIALGAADQALNGVVLAHRLDAERGLAARQFDGGVERCGATPSEIAAKPRPNMA